MEYNEKFRRPKRIRKLIAIFNDPKIRFTFARPRIFLRKKGDLMK